MIHITTADGADGHEIVTPRAIAHGAGDEYLVRLNRLFFEKEMRAYVRPLGEPNRCLNVYASYDCGGQLRDAAHKPRWYKLAFRRIYVIVHGGGKAGEDQPAPGRSEAAAADGRVGGLPAAPVAIVWSPLPSGSPIVPQNRPRHFYPGSRWVDWVGTDFYASYPEWKSLNGLDSRYAGSKPFALTEWGVENGDDPSFVSSLFAWVEQPPALQHARLLPGLRLDQQLPDPELPGPASRCSRPTSTRPLSRLRDGCPAPTAATPGRPARRAERRQA